MGRRGGLRRRRPGTSGSAALTHAHADQAAEAGHLRSHVGCCHALLHHGEAGLDEPRAAGEGCWKTRRRLCRWRRRQQRAASIDRPDGRIIALSGLTLREIKSGGKPLLFLA